MRFRNGVIIYHLGNSIHECHLKCSFGDFNISILNEYAIKVFMTMFSPTNVNLK